MIENKRYYWFKMKREFFEEMIIKFLRTQKKGDLMVLIFIKIMLISLSDSGYIKYRSMYPTFAEELALAIGEKADATEKTLEILMRFGAIEKEDEDTYHIAFLDDNIGSESAAALKKRKYRQGDISGTIEGQCPTETEIEKEKETEKDTELYQEKNAFTSSFSKKKGGGVKTKRGYNNYSKERKPSSYDLEEVLSEVETEELVYQPCGEKIEKHEKSDIGGFFVLPDPTDPKNLKAPKVKNNNLYD